MEDKSIILGFSVQNEAYGFKMLCLGVACASHGQMTVRQLMNLIQTVNAKDWHTMPGRWVKIIEIPSKYTLNYALDTTGWTISQLSEMALDKTELNDNSRKWALKLESPKELILENDKLDNINHPNHYVSGKFEVIDIIEEFCSSLEGRAAFDNGNAIKYILRWHRKNGVEDLKKAMWYIQDLVKQVESEENNNENSTDN